jgi:hypothetical protein
MGTLEAFNRALPLAEAWIMRAIDRPGTPFVAQGRG